MKAASNFMCMCCLAVTGTVVSAQPIPFTNYSGDFRMDPTGAVWASFYHEGPWKWLPKENDPAPFWTPQTSILFEAQYLPPEPRLDGTLALPYNGRITIQATDNGRIDGTPVGTMVFESPGVILMNMLPDPIPVDSQDTIFLLPFWLEAPAPMSLVEETGIFATDGVDVVGDLFQDMKGVVGMPTVEGMTPAEVMQAVPFSPDRVVGGISESVIYGTYVPEPATLTLLALGGCFLLGARCRRRTSAIGPSDRGGDGYSRADA